MPSNLSSCHSWLFRQTNDKWFHSLFDLLKYTCSVSNVLAFVWGDNLRLPFNFWQKLCKALELWVIVMMLINDCTNEVLCPTNKRQQSCVEQCLLALKQSNSFLYGNCGSRSRELLAVGLLQHCSGVGCIALYCIEATGCRYHINLKLNSNPLKWWKLCRKWHSSTLQNSSHWTRNL